MNGCEVKITESESFEFLCKTETCQYRDAVLALPRKNREITFDAMHVKPSTICYYLREKYCHNGSAIISALIDHVKMINKEVKALKNET